MKMLMPNDFEPGQKVWFLGMKAKVQEESLFDLVEDSYFGYWGVPISIKEDGIYRFLTIAHVDQLKPRGK